PAQLGRILVQRVGGGLQLRTQGTVPVLLKPAGRRADPEHSIHQRRYVIDHALQVRSTGIHPARLFTRVLGIYSVETGTIVGHGVLLVGASFATPTTLGKTARHWPEKVGWKLPL